jgi:hypothetical protein
LSFRRESAFAFALAFLSSIPSIARNLLFSQDAGCPILTDGVIVG